MNEEIPDFSDSVDITPTDSGDAISTLDMPDFSDSENLSEEPKPIEQRKSIISQIARVLTRGSIIERFQTSQYLQGKMPEVDPNDSLDTYSKKVEEALQNREDEIVGEGIGRVLESPMTGAMAVSGIINPVGTAVAVGSFAVLDQFFNLRRFTEENFPETAPEIKDIIEVTDFAIKGGIIGKGMVEGKKFFNNRLNSLGVAKNTNIKAEEIKRINESPELLPEEKLDMMQTLGMTEAQAQASINSGLPVNIKTENIINLAEKPYWERTKEELGIIKKLTPENKYPTLYQHTEKVHPIEEYPTLFQAQNVPQQLIPKIKSLQKEKNLSGLTVSKLKTFLKIDELKKAKVPQLEKLYDFMNELKKDDQFLSDKQIEGLKEIIKDIPNPEVTPKRVAIEKFGQKEEVFSRGIMGKVINELVPTVDIKQGNPLIRKIVDGAREKLDFAEKEVSRRNKQLDEMLMKAEKSRLPLLSEKERFSRSLTPQNKEIFQALGGEKISLTKEEAAVVAYLRNFFAMARKDLQLEKYRKNYVTHIEKDLTEKILDKGVIPAIKEVLAGQKEKSLPVDIMLELDNIIGSEKFFRYALKREGGIDPTSNLRKIINTYSNMYETKMALDQILPEGQAVTKLLLKGQDAVWMKNFLQNLKGRGLDSRFRTGKMGWLAKVADGVIDLGYLKMLGFNWKSALKNVVAGESNAWVYQDFPTYLKGKQRFISEPKKAYEMAKEYGILEGTYSDYAQKGIGKLKKLQDFSMVGQRAGEIEVRSSIFTSMLTEKEWSTGEISPSKVHEIKDVIAKTQGIFSNVDSPLLLQTWYGRMFFQMNRWRITNAMLLRGISTEALADIKQGKYNTQNVARFGKMLTAYGIGMYLSYELHKAGFKFAGDAARNSAQIIDGVTSLFTEGQLIKMFTDNPTLATFKEFSNTIMNTAHYLHFPGAKGAKEGGIEETYIAPIESIKDIEEMINQ